MGKELEKEKFKTLPKKKKGKRRIAESHCDGIFLRKGDINIRMTITYEKKLLPQLDMI